MVEVEKPGLTILGANAGRDATGDYRRRESIVEGIPDSTARGVVQLLANDITWDGFTIRGVFARQNSPGMYTSPTELRLPDPRHDLRGERQRHPPGRQR